MTSSFSTGTGFEAAAETRADRTWRRAVLAIDASDGMPVHGNWLGTAPGFSFALCKEAPTIQTDIVQLHDICVHFLLQAQFTRSIIYNTSLRNL